MGMGICSVNMYLYIYIYIANLAEMGISEFHRDWSGVKREYGDWKTYSPITDKIRELIRESTHTNWRFT